MTIVLQPSADRFESRRANCVRLRQCFRQPNRWIRHFQTLVCGCDRAIQGLQVAHVVHAGAVMFHHHGAANQGAKPFESLSPKDSVNVSGSNKNVRIKDGGEHHRLPWTAEVASRISRSITRVETALFRARCRDW